MYRRVGDAMVRASAFGPLQLPPWPDLTSHPARLSAWQEWLRQVWCLPGVAEAIRDASPVLAARVETLCAAQDLDAVNTRRARRLVASMVRYLLRARYRATPFGLFAGVAPAVFAQRCSARWGHEHRVVAVPHGGWLAEVVTRAEALPGLRERLVVVANTTRVVRGDRVIIPRRGSPGGGTDLGVSLRHTGPVRSALTAAAQPAWWSDVADKIAAEHPEASDAAVGDLLAQLVKVGALLSNLRPPATEGDPLGHLLAHLEAATAEDVDDAAAMVGTLRQIRVGVETHNQAHTEECEERRSLVASAMATLPSSRPLALDVRLDADVTLPEAVGWEVERAAWMLTVLSALPHGSPNWRDYHARFVEHYGNGTLVPLGEVLDPRSGVGWPAGYPGSTAEVPSEAGGARTRWLLEQAQAAALDGHREVRLDDFLAERAASGPAVCPPAHTELNVRVDSPSPAAVDSGRFRLVVLGASRNAGTMAGRLADLAGARETVSDALTESDEAVVPVQVSFPPLHADSIHLARSPQILDHLISVGEHPPFGPSVLTVEDLAVGCDTGGLYLWSHTLAHRVAPVVVNAVNLRAHAPPLVRLLSELPRSGRTALTGFDWHIATQLPFLPRLRAGRIVLSRAQWRLHARELPRRSTPWPEWEQEWRHWAHRRRLPDVVDLGAADQRLRLDLGEPTHVALVREHLDTQGSAVFTEAPAPSAAGWCGGRAHEVVVQLTSTQEHR